MPPRPGWEPPPQLWEPPECAEPVAAAPAQEEHWSSIAQQPLKKLEANFVAERPRGVAQRADMKAFMWRQPKAPQVYGEYRGEAAPRRQSVLQQMQEQKKAAIEWKRMIHARG